MEELHTLLTQGGVEGPYVPVGHSIGGVYVQLYAHEHPDQVVGMVLVDSSHEEQDLRFPEAYRRAEDRVARLMVLTMRLPQILSTVGVLALYSDRTARAGD